MTKFKISSLLCLLALSGCAGTTSISEGLSNYSGVSYEKDAHNTFVASYEKSKETKNYDQDDLMKCVLLSLKNDDTTLTDSSNSFFGQYSGTYYDIRNTSNVSGGEVIKYILKDSVGVIAQAKTSYSTTFGIAPITRSVRYDLLIEKNEDRVLFKAANITQAQIDSGASTNYGYSKLGAWDGANPDLAIASIDSDINKVHQCLNK